MTSGVRSLSPSGLAVRLGYAVPKNVPLCQSWAGRALGMPRKSELSEIKSGVSQRCSEAMPDCSPTTSGCVGAGANASCCTSQGTNDGVSAHSRLLTSSILGLILRVSNDRLHLGKAPYRVVRLSTEV